MKKIVNIITALLFLSLVSGAGDYFFNAVNSYKVSNGFVSIPLQFDPDESSSEYNFNNLKITVYGAL